MFFFVYVNVFIIVKILIQDRKLRLKESIYIILTGIFADLVFAVHFLASNWHQLSDEFVIQPSHIHPFSPHFFDAFAALFLFLYLCKSRKYPAKKAIILTLSAMLIAAIIDHSLPLVLQSFLPVGTVWSTLIALLLLYAISILFALLVVKFSKKLRKTINQSKSIQTALLCIITFLLISFQASVIFGLHMVDLGYTTNVMLINAIFFVAFTMIAFVSFVMFAKSLESKFEMQVKETERQSLEHYTAELERNQTDMRKFKHDYQNILLSIDTFLDENDLEGLKQYYVTKIATASQVITNNDIALEGLSRIKVREIKSILATKLMMAQNLGIDATFEADEEVNHIPVDSVVLVRMLGIVLDNAIEELTENGEGRLLVGCFKYESTITFIVQNTCRPNMPELHHLLKAGFSTKGKNRGLGLASLQELADSQPNVTLETGIEEDRFTQRIMINTQYR